MFILETPTKLRIPPEIPESEARRALKFKSLSALYEFNRFKKNKWYSQEYGQEAYQEKLEQLKKAVEVCLLKQDKNGFYTYSGLTQYLEKYFKMPVVNNISYPKPQLIPFEHPMSKTPRYYQTDGVEKLLEAKHAGVEIGTGLGKSLMIIMLCKKLGLQTLVMSPSLSIANQLYKEFVYYFGKRKVGMFGDGKKKLDKQFTIGIAASLTRIKKDTPAWNYLSQSQVFIVDESHLTPADTLEAVCMGVAANAPYRFFLSATQQRADGSDLLLEGITGPIVYSMTVRQGVDEGFLAKPNFFIHNISNYSTYLNSDYKRMAQKHFWGNTELHKYAAELANKSVGLLDHQVLILIEHVDQFQYLYPHLKYEVGFAHGPLNDSNKGTVDINFQKSKPDELVERFNNRKLPILIGTSCISLGTDIIPVKTLINLQGGASEVKIRQAIGRGTRKTEGKDSFNYHDFYIEMPDSIHLDGELTSIERHALIRRNIFDDVYGTTIWINNHE